MADRVQSVVKVELQVVGMQPQIERHGVVEMEGVGFQHLSVPQHRRI